MGKKEMGWEGEGEEDGQRWDHVDKEARGANHMGRRGWPPALQGKFKGHSCRGEAEMTVTSATFPLLPSPSLPPHPPTSQA